MEQNFATEEKTNLVYSYLSDTLSEYNQNSPVPSFMTPFLNSAPNQSLNFSLSSTPSTSSFPNASQMKQLKNSSKRKWGLGLLVSKDPDNLMKQVMAALKASDLEWKITGPFELKCRNISTESNKQIKLILQIYKVADQKYLLDVKNAEGHTFPLFDTCSNLLKHLEKTEKI